MRLFPPNNNAVKLEYLFFALLYPIALLPTVPQTVILIMLAFILLPKRKPKLDRFFSCMLVWCILYLASILINLHRTEHSRANIIVAFFTLGLNVAALLFYIHFRNVNVNLTRIGRCAFWNILILILLAMIYLLIPASREWALFGKNMAEIDILRGNVYGYRFCGFLGSTYIVVFFIFFNFPLSVYYIQKRLKKHWQILYALAIFATVYAAGSRIGFLLYGLLFVLFLIVEIWEKIRIFYGSRKAASVAVFATAIVLLAIFGGYLAKWLILSRPGSNIGRILLYQQSIRDVLTRSPAIGLGINDLLSPDGKYYLGTRSTYIDVLYRTGILGFAVYLLAIGFRLYDLFKDKVLNKQRTIYIIAIIETLLLMIVEDVDTNPWTICFFYIMVAIFDRISQPVETLAIKPSLNIAMLGQKHIRYREGGVEVVVAELSTRMVQLGHHVTCYDRGGHHVSGKGYDSEKKSVYHGVVVKQVFTINKKGLAAFSSAFSAAVQASFSNADVVHFHAEGPCVMMWLPKLFGKCCVCTIHGIDWQRAKWSGMGKKVIHYGEKVAAREADEIIVLSKSAQDYFWNTYHRKTVLLPNGIDPAEPVPVREIQKQYGLAKGQYILFLGRIVPEKGIHYLIQAFRQIRTDKKLVIAGGASDTASYFEEVKKQAEGDDRILFTGFVSGRPMQELYSNAYLYVLPSDLEGMPLTILEAMSYGDCCVVSDIPECADVVGDAGVTFRHGDAKDLQNVLERCFDDPELTRHLGDLARERVKACYDWDEITRRTIGVYRGTLDVVSEKDAIRRMERE